MLEGLKPQLIMIKSFYIKPITLLSFKQNFQTLRTSWFLFLFCLIIGTTAKGETTSVSNFLMPDGSINVNIISSQELTLDISDWNIVLDISRGPIFSPKPPLITSWSALDKGLNRNAFVSAIAISGSNVYVVGSFSGVGTGGSIVSGLNNIAKWNGTAWSALDKGLNGSITAIAVSGTSVYVVGFFSNVGTGGTSVQGLNHVAKWNGLAWSALDKGIGKGQLPGEEVDCVAVNGTNVYVGGYFNAVGVGGTEVSGLNNIAKWNGIAWVALDKGLGPFSSVQAIAVNGTDIYVGGGFSEVGNGGVVVSGLNHIAKWNGIAWSALDKGLNNLVRSISVNGTDIYVGGWFTDVGDGATSVSGLNRIAKWNGVVWSALDKGLNQAVNAVTSIGSDVYTIGVFTNVGGGTPVSGLNYLAKWNGTTWSSMEQGLNAIGGAIAASGTDVYVSGDFSTVGGGVAVTGLNAIGKWNTLAIVPVELLDFKVNALHNNNILNWQTASEKNSDHFDVERSTDGNQFIKIGEVKAFGSTNQVQNYNYLDVSLPPQYNVFYYRLRQVDKDNKAEYSPIRSISIDKQDKSIIKIYPNPNNGQFVATITISDKDTEFSIQNSRGQVIWKGIIAAGQESRNIQLEQATNGLYFVSYRNSQGFINNSKFVINR